MTRFQIKGGGFVQGVKKLTTTLATFGGSSFFFVRLKKKFGGGPTYFFFCGGLNFFCRSKKFLDENQQEIFFDVSFYVLLTKPFL